MSDGSKFNNILKPRIWVLPEKNNYQSNRYKMNLKNNTILITGGTSGFGLQFAKQLLALGKTVITTGRDEAKLDETKKLFPGFHIFKSDVSNPKAIAELYENIIVQFLNLSMLINNAGEMRKINIHDTKYWPEDITREIDINLSGHQQFIHDKLIELAKQKLSTTDLSVNKLAFCLGFEHPQSFSK